MANSKNTIQQIPLNGTLNMNTLKTDVKQFEGYNEKNSTVFGGTLSPFYSKKTEIAPTDDTLTIYNSKGDYYTFYDRDDGTTGIKSTDSNINGKKISTFTKLQELDVPEDCLYAAQLGEYLCYISSDLKCYVNGRAVAILDNVGTTIYSAYIRLLPQPIDGEDFITFIVCGNKVCSGYFYNTRDKIEPIFSKNFTISSGVDSQCIITCGFENGIRYAIHVYIVSKYGLISKDDTKPIVYEIIYDSIDKTVSVENVSYYRCEIPFNLFLSNAEYFRDIDKDSEGLTNTGYFTLRSPAKERTYEVYQFAERACYSSWNTKKYEAGTFADSPATIISENITRTTGHNGEGFIPSPLCAYDWDTQFVYLNGTLASISCFGFPIDDVFSIEQTMVSTSFRKGLYYINYKAVNNKWKCFTILDSNIFDSISNGIKIIDNRYILFFDIDRHIYDIEDKKFLSNTKDMGLVDSQFPFCLYGELTEGTKLTGAMYASGYQAGYTTKMYNPFIGLLFNPSVMTNIPDCCDHYPTNDLGGYRFERTIHNTDSFQKYFTMGNNVRSAKYKGNTADFSGTYYSIDANGNALIPISLNTDIIGGYSNNSMVLTNNKVYPLTYNNVNTRIFNYYLLSFMENIEGAFSLQGQTYTFDSDNIYATVYNAGIIQDAKAVCYKSHMRFLGTLPTQAIFWSDFNKTFYSFTGDRVLTKLFEASDINKIYYIGQNPASLSLWICTDKGTYVLSDTDMYRLNYVSKSKPYFTDKYAIITTTEKKDVNGELVDYNYENDISLYDIENNAEMVPVKLKTCYYGLGAEHKAVMDCWYIRLYDEKKSEGDVKVKVNTITDVTRQTEEKIFHINASDYDDNNIVYLRYQPKYQECTAMQLELESPIGIYELALGVNATDTTAQVSKFNF